MDDAKVWESSYSGERTKVTGPTSLRSSFETETAESPESQKGAPAATSDQTENKPATAATPATPATPSKDTSSPPTFDTVNALPGIVQPSDAGLVADFVGFLNRTKYIWLIAAGVTFGVMGLVTLQKRNAERAQIARAARQEHAVATITLDALLARCGQPAEDATKDMYPMLVRTMTYQPRENEKVVFEFSRTAEEKSEWLFLSMKDGSGTRSFDTPEAKIAALPCLDLKK